MNTGREASYARPVADQREELVAAFSRHAATQQASEPTEIAPPEDWPHRFCTYEEARGFIVRLRAAGSREGKVIAAEYGVTRMTVSRAVRSALVHLGEYDPEGWSRYNRERSAQARKRFCERMKERDQQVRAVNAEIAQSRDAVAEHRYVAELEEERLAPPLVSSSLAENALRKERRRRAQRRLNERNRPRAAW